jgi:hypothetical protein
MWNHGIVSGHDAVFAANPVDFTVLDVSHRYLFRILGRTFMLGTDHHTVQPETNVGIFLIQIRVIEFRQYDVVHRRSGCDPRNHVPHE